MTAAVAIRLGGVGPLSSPGIAYDAIAVAADALRRAPDLDAETICASLREAETPGTRGPVRFSSEPEGVVHQQWAWPPVCVAAHASPGRPLSETDVLWVAPEAGA